MKTAIIIFFVLIGSLIINSCQKDGNGNGQNKSSNNNTNNNNQDTTQNTLPAPAVSITQTPLTILLPNNCQQTFIIKNTGPQGSILNYTIADDGALSGFLSFTNGTGSLSSGISTTIMVSVKPSFVNSNPSLNGALSKCARAGFSRKARSSSNLCAPSWSGRRPMRHNAIFFRM